MCHSFNVNSVLSFRNLNDETPCLESSKMVVRIESRIKQEMKNVV